MKRLKLFISTSLGSALIGLCVITLLSDRLVPNAVAEDESKLEAEAKKPSVMEIDLTLNRPENSRGYRKPYVAVWLEDKDGFPVRTLALWVQKDPPGPRWIPDLRQWYRSDRMRQLVEDSNLVDGLSGATRAAGNYKIAWDGMDGSGKDLEPATYTLCVEAAREHGTYQITRFPFEHGSTAFEKDLKGNEEVKSLHVRYRVMPKPVK